MAQASQKTYLVAKISHQINRLQDVISTSKPNFDMENFKCGLRADLQELEQVTKVLIGTAESELEIKSLINEVIELTNKAEELLSQYDSSTCDKGLMKYLPTREMIQMAARSVLDWKRGLIFGSILLTGAVLVVRWVANLRIYTEGWDDVVLRATAWTSLSFYSFLGLTSLLQTAVGIKSTCCKVYEIAMSLATVIIWFLSIGLIIFYRKPFSGGTIDYSFYAFYESEIPISYFVIQLTLCALCVTVQIIWILVNVRGVVRIRRNGSCEQLDSPAITEQSSLVSLT